MRYNSFSYIPSSFDNMVTELQDLGFQLNPHDSPKDQLRAFLERYYFQSSRPELHWNNLLARWDQNLADFLTSSEELDASVFYMVALQLLGFVPKVDFNDLDDFRNKINFPITYGNLIENLYHLLNIRSKKGNLLIDQLVSQGLIPEDNDYHFFNGKSLATFNTHNLIREIVYVESRVDTDQDGLPDLVKVNILRPRTQHKIPAIMTASPYHLGVNGKAADQALHNMNQDLERKPARTIEVEDRSIDLIQAQGEAELVTESSEQLGAIANYTLNDYLLARGMASIYVSGLGTLDSDGLMTSGDYRQIEAYKNVIDWLNGRCRAFTDRSRQFHIQADWCNGKVATTGISYLGTMSNGLATTGVEGLEVIIAEAGISSWYNYYRENGLVTSPGGYPGEDFESLTEFTYSRNLLAGDTLRHNAQHQTALARMRKELDRQTGDYNQFWQDRNYLPHAHKVQASVVFTHGLQDWNVKPNHVYQMFQALPDHIQKHLFLHHGAHVYMNNWQSIDFRESMNALLSQKLLALPNHYQLPTVIWQNNRLEQDWQALVDFGTENHRSLHLGAQTATIQNAYPADKHAAYSKHYQSFLADLHKGDAQAIAIDLILQEDLFLNGPAHLELKVKSSTDKGILSAQILDYQDKKHLQAIPELLSGKSMDNGRYFMLDNLVELPFKQVSHRVISKGYLNLQNRDGLLQVKTVPADEWMDITLPLQPSIYQMKAGETLRVLLYTVDYEVTIRDQEDYQLTVDLAQSKLILPISDK